MTSPVSPAPPAVSGSPRRSAPVRVAVYLADQNPHRDRSLGITSMTRTLLDEFARRDWLRLTQIVSRSSYVQPQDDIRVRRLPMATDHPVGRVLADGFHAWVCPHDVDLLYYPKGYVSRYARAAVPTIGTMHDTIVQHYADHYPTTRSARAFRYWIDQTGRSLRRLDRVMTVSEHARMQLLAFCERYAIDPPPIDVTYESSLWEHRRPDEFEKQDCVVHLASTAPHKRTNELLRMWKRLVGEGRHLPRLDLVGRLDAAGESILAELPNAKWTPPQSTDQLQASVGRARALILPSEIEGFGLPALESYYVGTPACFVRGTSVSEVVLGDDRGQFDLGDTASFASALNQTLAMDDDAVHQVADRMRAKFSTARVADGVLKVFAALI